MYTSVIQTDSVIWSDSLRLMISFVQCGKQFSASYSNCLLRWYCIIHLSEQHSRLIRQYCSPQLRIRKDPNHLSDSSGPTYGYQTDTRNSYGLSNEWYPNLRCLAQYAINKWVTFHKDWTIMKLKWIRLEHVPWSDAD